MTHLYREHSMKIDQGQKNEIDSQEMDPSDWTNLVNNNNYTKVNEKN